nr:hypothetical protein GCM10020093_039100 [Planobispora longispora]
MRRPLRTAAVTVAAVACLLLPSGSVSEPVPAPSDGARDGCVLRIASGADVSGGVREQVLDTVWNSAGNRPRACFVVVSEVADEQRSEMVSAAQAESGRYDVFNLDIQWIPEFAAEGRLLPIDPAAHSVTNDFLAQIWSAGAWEGTQYAVPLNTDVGLLYYRADLLAGPPPAGRRCSPRRSAQVRARLARPPLRRAVRLLRGADGQPPGGDLGQRRRGRRSRGPGGDRHRAGQERPPAARRLRAGGSDLRGRAQRLRGAVADRLPGEAGPLPAALALRL